VAAAGWSLWTGQGQEFVWPGLLVSLMSGSETRVQDDRGEPPGRGGTLTLA